MAQQDLVSLELTAAEIDQLKAALGTLKTILGPRLISLTPDQRSELLKMGDTLRGYCAKAIPALNTNADALPPAFDREELNRDWTDYEALEAFLGEFNGLAERLRDTRLALSSDIFTSVLIGTGFLKALNKLDPSLDDLLAELRAARRRKPRKPTDDTPAA